MKTRAGGLKKEGQTIPRWRYITEAYRQARRIPVVPTHRRRDTLVSQRAAGQTLPSRPATYGTGIVFEEAVYERETANGTTSWTRAWPP